MPGSGGLWDATFRARMLRQGLSNDEMAQAVEVAEAVARERDAIAARLVALEQAAEAGLSRLTLARAAMRSYLKHGDRSTLEAWLLASEENRWLEQISEALGPEAVLRRLR